MLNMEIQKILEYRLYQNTDHVLVMWEDGTTSWIRAQGLKCKDKMCEFVSEALEILRKHKRSITEQSLQEKEEKLLDRILVKNLEDLHSTEMKQSEIINNIVGDKRLRSTRETSMRHRSLPKNAGRYFTSTAENACSDPAESLSPGQSVKPIRSHHGIHQNEQWQGVEARSEALDGPRVKRAASEIVKANTMIVAISQDTSIAINFRFRDTPLTVSIDVSASTFVSFDVLAPHLYSIYLSGSGFPFFPSEEPEGTPRTDFESYMRSNRLFLIHRQEECAWILYAPESQDNLFKVAISSRFLVFRIEGDSFLNDLCGMKNFVGENTVWSQGTFRFGSGVLGDFLYKDAIFPQSKGIFLLGNSRLMRHLLSFAKNRGEIVGSMELASTVLIQKSYMDFLHQVPGFYESLHKRARFFLESGSCLEEILINGGMVTFSNEFIESFELLAVADLVGALSRRKNWEVKVRRSTYVALKKRLSAHQCAPEHLSKMKGIYRVFRESILEGFEGNLRDYLESRHYKTHRFFLEVSLLKLADGTVTIDEALQIVTSS